VNGPVCQDEECLLFDQASKYYHRVHKKMAQKQLKHFTKVKQERATLIKCSSDWKHDGKGKEYACSGHSTGRRIFKKGIMEDHFRKWNSKGTSVLTE
jgi:hypothetical protein